MSNVKTNEEKKAERKSEYMKIPHEISERLLKIANLKDGIEKDLQIKAVKEAASRFAMHYKEFKNITQLAETPGIYISPEGQVKHYLRLDAGKIAFVNTITNLEGKESHVVVSATSEGQAQINYDSEIVQGVFRNPSLKDIDHIRSEKLTANLPSEIVIVESVNEDLTKNTLFESLRDINKF